MKQRLITDTKIKQEIDAVSEILGKKGRILVRPSGTEPLIRVMLEGEDIAQIKSLAKRVAGVIEDRINEDS
jgi:phosphoglucosamine mutase